MAKPTPQMKVEHTRHDATRKNIPTEEHKPMLDDALQRPIHLAIDRRNQDLDPQLVWRGKQRQDEGPLTVMAPPLFIQEKVHPKQLIDDLRRHSEQLESASNAQPSLFSDFNGLPSETARTEFYQHEAHWSNRMILGDSLQVMASLAEREGLRGKVQCIYFDPPYGIKFNSNFQWSTTSRDVKDGKANHITREPEQVKAFRDTWRDGIHSYLSYIRDRLTLARDLLTESGSIFVQIGDENVHRVRSVMDEVFGEDNACSLIAFVKTTGFLSNTLPNVSDYLLWYSKSKASVKFRQPFFSKVLGGDGSKEYTMASFADGTRRPLQKSEKDNPETIPEGARVFRLDNLRSQGGSDDGSLPYAFEGVTYPCGSNMHWKTRRDGLDRLAKSQRISGRGEGKTLCYVRFVEDFAAYPMSNIWTDAASGDNQVLQKLYVVQTLPKVIERCLLMTTDPGDLVLDPTCGSGTTATVAEQWGRRWITIDTSRVALALARARIMGARYPFYLLADSREGQLKEAEVTRSVPISQPVHGNIRHGFVYERVPHITLKSIANNAEIDVIWDQWQLTLEPLREQLNAALKKTWQEWEIPREADAKWPEATRKAHSDWWAARIARQREIDKSIAAKAEFEFLYDKPYQDNKKVRVAGPFTVESISPHRSLAVNEDGDPFDPGAVTLEAGEARDFTAMILENLRTSGVQQAHKEDRITFTALSPWPGRYVCAEGLYVEREGEKPKRAAVFVGPEFGTVSRSDLVDAVREAADGQFDVLIACAFNFDAASTDFSKLGRVPILKARMNADLHMAEDLKNTGKGNLFVIFGEPDIELLPVKVKGKPDQYQLRVKGVDVFDPTSGEVRSDGPDGIACWFIDTEYNSESFFVRHAYFLGANDPYKSLKTTLKAEINAEAWESLNSDISRPFPKPSTNRVAVKVINHLGDEVMKVFRV